MHISALSLFPEILQSYFAQSIMARAVRRGYISYSLVNIRDYAENVHKTVDDSPYGGGAGMLMRAEPLCRALETLEAQTRGRVVYPSPSGTLLDEQLICELSEEENLTFICGRYEGIDQRIINEFVDNEISIGNYVLSSGELAAMVIVDSVFRRIDGVISRQSLKEESFTSGVLEYPQYTRPEVFRGQAVPPVLLSGNHEGIRKWRRKESLRKTMRTRSDLLENITLSAEDRKLLQEITEEEGHESFTSSCK